VSADDANVGAERMDYVARAIGTLNDAYALTRSAVSGLPPHLLERAEREKRTLMLGEIVAEATNAARSKLKKDDSIARRTARRRSA
jgi:hypothetical protein